MSKIELQKKRMELLREQQEEKAAESKTDLVDGGENNADQKKGTVDSFPDKNEILNELEEVEQKHTGIKRPYQEAKPNSALVGFERGLRYKDLSITNTPIRTLNVFRPIMKAYSDYTGVIKTVYNMKMSMTEIANEALIRYLKDVLMQDPIYKEAKKRYDKILKDQNDVLQ